MTSRLTSRSYEVPGPAPDMTDLPLIIREKDIEYQFHRVILFQRLLEVRLTYV